MNPLELFDLAEVDRRTRLPKPRELQVGTFVPPREFALAFLALRTVFIQLHLLEMMHKYSYTC